MAGAQDPNEGLVMSQIFVQRSLQPDGSDLMIFSAVDGEGGKLPMVEALGLIELAKNGLLSEVGAPICVCEEVETDEGDDD
jgi:hypothetical protein